MGSKTNETILRTFVYPLPAVLYEPVVETAPTPHAGQRPRQCPGVAEWESPPQRYSLARSRTYAVSTTSSGSRAARARLRILGIRRVVPRECYLGAWGDLVSCFAFELLTFW